VSSLADESRDIKESGSFLLLFWAEVASKDRRNKKRRRYFIYQIILVFSINIIVFASITKSSFDFLFDGIFHPKTTFQLQRLSIVQMFLFELTVH
jgi:hypothetical protein